MPALDASPAAPSASEQSLDAFDLRQMRSSPGANYSVISPRCPEGRPGEIVVCAPDEEKYRAQSTSQEDPLSDQALNDGRLTPPDVAGKGIFKGKATATFGKVEQPYIIDLSAIPEAPAGSDADKVAKGEMRAH